MPEPLIAKGSARLSLPWQVVVIIFGSGPLVALWYVYHHGGVIHFDNPRWNLAAHAALFIVPLIWVGLMCIKPVEYEAPADNTMIAKSTFSERWTLGWWMMFVLWATPVVAIFVLGDALVTRDLAHPEILSTSFWKAWGIIALVFCLCLFYWTMLSGKDQVGTWVSDEGLRTSVHRFHEWKNIHHMSRHGDVFTVYHNVNPAIPLGAFKVRDPEARALLERQLAGHQIRMLDDPSPILMAIKVGVLLGFAGNVAFSLWLRFHMSFSFITVVLVSFAIGIVLCLLLEQFRGIPKIRMCRAEVQFSDDGENEDYSKEELEDEPEDDPEPTK